MCAKLCIYNVLGFKKIFFRSPVLVLLDQRYKLTREFFIVHTMKSKKIYVQCTSFTEIQKGLGENSFLKTNNSLPQSNDNDENTHSTYIFYNFKKIRHKWRL